jgi:hypothetical protein
LEHDLARQTQEKDERMELVDWVISIHDKINCLSRETLWHCISVIDTFLSTRLIDPERYQLLGTASLSLASKIYDKESISLKSCKYLTRNCYSERDILDMEESISEVMSHSSEFYSGSSALALVTQFVDMVYEELSDSNWLDHVLRNLAYYYAERYLVDGCSLLHRNTSVFAAGVVFSALSAMVYSNHVFRAFSPQVLTRKKSTEDDLKSFYEEKENTPNRSSSGASPMHALRSLSSSSSGGPGDEPATSPRSRVSSGSLPPPPVMCLSSLWSPDLAIRTGISASTAYRAATAISRVISKDVLISKFSCAYSGSYPQVFVSTRNKYTRDRHGRVAELPLCGSMGCSIDVKCSCERCVSTSASIEDEGYSADNDDGMGVRSEAI